MAHGSTESTEINLTPLQQEGSQFEASDIDQSQ